MRNRPSPSTFLAAIKLQKAVLLAGVAVFSVLAGQCVAQNSGPQDKEKIDIDDNASLARLITGKTNLPVKAPGLTSQEIASSQSASPLTQLSWDAVHKEMSTKPGQLAADFSFRFTNISDAEVVIDHVKTSCSCTAAKLPAEPWHLPPHTNGEIKVTVDLKDKMGEFDKTVTVFFAGKDVPPKVLNLTVKMPDMRVMRAENMLIAQADRQAVFKGDCARCHAEPAKTESGMALYHDVCGICHEAKPRASVVPDLRFITQHLTDYSFWKTNIANGKPGTLMPAFAISQGGPLTDEQIDTLAKMLDQAYPYSRFSKTPPASKSTGN